MSEENPGEPVVAIQTEQEAPDARTLIELNKSTAEANRSAIELNQSNIELMLANTPQGLAMRLELQAKQQKIQSEQLEMQSALQAKQLEMLRNFQEEQLKNLQTTFEIMFGQTKGAALMFYVSFWLGVALVIASVCSYLIFRDANNLLTIAFFGVGALAMLTFFLRDPAVKVQQTAGKLVQLQFAMRAHLTEIGYWEIYLAQQRELGVPIKIEELERASHSIRSATHSTMQQIDESLDDPKNDNGNYKAARKVNISE
jgi:hypothetical protein